MPLREPVRRAAGHRRGRTDRGGDRRCQHQGLHSTPSPARPTARRAASRSTSAPNPAPPRPRKSAPSSRPPASPLYDANKLPELGDGKIRQRGRSGRSGSAWPRQPTAAPIKRPSDGGEVKIRGVRAVRRPARRDGQAPALLLRLLLPDQRSSRRCTSRTPTRTIDTVVIYTDLRMPGNGEDFYRSAPEQGRDLHQGQGVQRSKPPATRAR